VAERPIFITLVQPIVEVWQLIDHVEIDGELRILEGAELDKAMETRDAG
jgi:hypothetical protein